MGKKLGKLDMTDEQFDLMFEAAAEAGAKARASEPRALSARYDREDDRIVVVLQNGWEFGFKPWLAQGLESATPAQLSAVDVVAGGAGLRWEALDADLGVASLLAGRYGSRAHMARVAARYTGAKGGAKTSEAKAAAARANGAKGGRPRKKAETTFVSAEPRR